MDDWVGLEDRPLQVIFAGVMYRAAALVGHFEGFSELNAPLEKQLQLGFHGMGAGLHHHKAALGHGFQLVRGHQGSFHHLQRLGIIILPLGDGTGEDGAAAQVPGQCFRRLTVGGKAPEDGVLS